jgi:hypothetical protein
VSVNLTPLGKPDFQIINIDNDANCCPLYVGWAPPGTLNSDASWLIAKLGYDAGGCLSSLRYANASLDYDQIWDNRAGLIYG